MRPVHAEGGAQWSWETLDSAERARVQSPTGDEIQCRLEGGLQWKDAPVWYERFSYPEEKARGYRSEENLFSAGSLVADIPAARNTTIAISDEK